MPANFVAELERSLEIDSRPVLEGMKHRASHRLGNEIKARLIARESSHRETAPVYRDTRALLDAGERSFWESHH